MGDRQPAGRRFFVSSCGPHVACRASLIPRPRPEAVSAAGHITEQMMAVPTKDSELVAYGDNFDTRATATPTAFGLTAPQAAAFNAKYTPFVAAYEALVAARAAGIRS